MIIESSVFYDNFSLNVSSNMPFDS